MLITKSSTPLDPGALPLREIVSDWHGEATECPVAYGFGVDPEHLHFRAARAAPACVHPEARPGEFVAELWKYDAAEFFIGHPESGVYLEFNLAPHGAWWSCLFSAPRERVSADDTPLPGVVTRGNHGSTGWEATASLPLASLREGLGIGSRILLNATFIVDSPAQRFISAAPLGPGEPDFHRPAHFPSIDLP